MSISSAWATAAERKRRKPLCMFCERVGTTANRVDSKSSPNQVLSKLRSHRFHEAGQRKITQPLISDLLSFFLPCGMGRGRCARARRRRARCAARTYGEASPDTVSFFRWLRANGVGEYDCLYDPAVFPIFGRGARAKRAIASGETIVSSTQCSCQSSPSCPSAHHIRLCVRVHYNSMSACVHERTCCSRMSAATQRHHCVSSVSRGFGDLCMPPPHAWASPGAHRHLF
jgi:hypothetical protein